MAKITLSEKRAPHILRFTWRGWTVAKAFTTRTEMEAYREHIRRVWGANTAY